MQYTEQDLLKLVKNLEVEFSAQIAEVIAAAQPTLTKAEDEGEKEGGGSKDKPADKKPESEAKGKDEAPKAEGESDAPPKKDGEGEAAAAPKEGEGEAPAAPAAEAAPAAPAEGDASGYDAEDIAHMDAMYMSMSKAELLAHHDSCVRALDAIGAEHTHAAPAAPAAAPAAPAPEASAPAAAAPAGEIDKCGDMSMAKSENQELELAKSEVEAQKAKNAELQKSLDTVSEFLTKLVKKVPQGKAITSMEQIAKNESGATEEKQLSKSEITEILMKKAADPTLSKTDREAINAYYLNKSDLKTISHLLK